MPNLASINQQIEELNAKRKQLIAANARRAKEEMHKWKLAVGAAVMSAIDQGQLDNLVHREDMAQLVEAYRKRRRICNGEETEAVGPAKSNQWAESAD